MRKASPIVTLLAVALSLAACGGARLENVALKQGEANEERRTIIPETPDRPVIIMTFSGGGSRATALAASVLRELNGATYVIAGRSFPLSADVKVISSVSGGSVTAAWFGLNRDAEHPDGRLDQLRSAFLVKDNIAALEWRAANPITWLRLTLTDYTRIGELEALFDRTLFADARMREMNQPGKPFVFLNATDIAGGQTFTFSPRRMDDICSSLDDLKISTGVAASAAFPVAFSPVSFKNFSTIVCKGDPKNDPQVCVGTLRDAAWTQREISSTNSRHLNLERFRDAIYTSDLRRLEHTFHDVEYVHFLDGGLADNLGIRTLRGVLLEREGVGLIPAINDGKIKRLAVVVVNARSDPPNELYKLDGTPGVISAFKAVTSIPIDSNTANSQISLQQLLKDIAEAGSGDAGLFQGMKVYGVTVDFDQLPADTDPHRDLRSAVKTIHTSWTISDADLTNIDKAAKLLLDTDPCYQALLRDLNVAGAAAPSVGAPACSSLIAQ